MALLLGSKKGACGDKGNLACGLLLETRMDMEYAIRP